MFQNFEERMTGVYTCFLEYKPTVEEVVKNLQLKYVVYGKKCIKVCLNVSQGLQISKHLNISVKDILLVLLF